MTRGPRIWSLAGLTIYVFLLLGCNPRSSAPIYINEILPSNSSGCADPSGERNDWIELYNGGTTAIDLGGYSITDDSASPQKHRFAHGLTIEPGGVILLWADGSTEDQGPTHLSFKFKAIAERVVLYDPDGKQIDEHTWTYANSDVSMARIPDGTGEWVNCATPTCGALNGSACTN